VQVSEIFLLWTVLCSIRLACELSRFPLDLRFTPGHGPSLEPRDISGNIPHWHSLSHRISAIYKLVTVWVGIFDSKFCLRFKVTEIALNLIINYAILNTLWIEIFRLNNIQLVFPSQVTSYATLVLLRQLCLRFGRSYFFVTTFWLFEGLFEILIFSCKRQTRILLA
jgi:hypothetical protein